MKYELFHINFASFHCTGRNELNKLTSLPTCGFIAQLVEHRMDYAECRVRKMRSTENAECGKCGVWKMRSVENAECGTSKMHLALF